MKHDYTDEEIREAWFKVHNLSGLSPIGFLHAFLGFLPERPQAAEIAGMKAELAEYVRRLQAAEHINEGYRAMEQKLEEAQAAVAELNQRLIERTRDMLSKQSELIHEARQAKREARDALADRDLLKATLENTKGTLRYEKISFRKEEERATANLRRAERAEAKLATLRQPILAYDKARPQAAEIEALKAECDEMNKDLSALLRVLNAHDATEGVETARYWEQSIKRLKDEHDKAQAELAAMSVDNEGLKVILAVETDAKDDVNAELAKLKGELAESQRKLAYAEEHLGILAKTFGYEGRTWCNMVSYLGPRLQRAERELSEIKGYLWPNQTGLPNEHRNALAAIKRREEIQERYISDLKAELAALRAPILADDGRSLGQVAEEAYEESSIHLKESEWWQAAAQAALAAARPAIEAECLAQAVRRMEAVPFAKMLDIFGKAEAVGGWDAGIKEVQSLFIAAVKDVEANHVRPNAAERLGLDSFVAAMKAELAANAHKGNWADWKPSIHDLDGEVEHHLNKMVTAFDAGHFDQAAEYAADIGNYAFKAFEMASQAAKGEGQAQGDAAAIDDDGNPATISDEPSEPYHAPEVPEAKPEPATFEVNGEKWNEHITESSPVEANILVDVLLADNTTITRIAGGLRWKKSTFSPGTNIIGWRYADKPAQAEEAEAQPWTPAVGDTVRLKSGGPNMTVVQADKFDNNLCSWFNELGKSLSVRFPAACLTPAKEGQQ